MPTCRNVAASRLRITVSLRGVTRLGITSTIFLLTLTFSPAMIFVNSALATSSISTPLPTISTIPSSPSTITQDGRDGEFTTQAALQIPRTLQSTDLVNSLAFYVVTFITSTTGTIDKIEMEFPAGTNIGASGVIERVGIGGGTLIKSGNTLTYDITTPVSVPAGTFIRLEMFGIKNPGSPSTTFTATLTTRDSGGAIIDGPSTTNVYTIRQIGTNDLADSSITSSKPNESFMKRVILEDDAEGNALGWNPNGVTTVFQISEPAITCELSGCSFVSIFIFPSPVVTSCEVTSIDGGLHNFGIRCLTAPVDTNSLQYVVENLPPHIP